MYSDLLVSTFLFSGETVIHPKDCKLVCSVLGFRVPSLLLGGVTFVCIGL